MNKDKISQLIISKIWYYISNKNEIWMQQSIVTHSGQLLIELYKEHSTNEEWLEFDDIVRNKQENLIPSLATLIENKFYSDSIFWEKVEEILRIKDQGFQFDNLNENSSVNFLPILGTILSGTILVAKLLGNISNSFFYIIVCISFLLRFVLKRYK